MPNGYDDYSSLGSSWGGENWLYGRTAEAPPGAIMVHNEAGSFWSGAPDATPSQWVLNPYNNTVTASWEPVVKGGTDSSGFKTYSTDELKEIVKGYELPGTVNYGQNDFTNAYQNKKFNEYVSALPEWQQGFYKSTVPFYDQALGNYGFKPNADGTYSVIKTNFGGDYDYQVQQAQNDPVDTNVFHWKYDPKTGTTSDYYQYDAPGTTGNSYAPIFVGLGTLLTGGMLAPLAAGFGVAGGAALGAGLGGASSALNSQLATGSVDLGKVGQSMAMGGIGGGIMAGLGGASMFGPGEFAMTPGTELAYGMEQYPSGWEGSIYGSEEGLIGATGSAEGWAGGYDFGDFESEADWANYWEDVEDIPESMDFAVESATGSKLTDIAKKLGMQAAKSVAKSVLGGGESSGGSQGTGGVANGTAAGLLSSTQSKMPQLTASSSLPEIQQVGSLIGVPVSEKEAKKLKTEFLKYDLSNDTLTPDYWRFMSDAEEGI